MIINHNLAAINSQRHLFGLNQEMDRSLERLSSGMKINHGADDAYGLAIAEKMNMQNAGLTVAQQNVQDGQALFRVAEGALAQVGAMLTRMEEMAVRAANGTMTDTDRAAMMDEVRELRDQINQISHTTEYNSMKLLNGSMSVQATLNADHVTVLSKPEGFRSGNVSFHLTRHASAATIQGNILQPTVLTSGVNSSGMININGSDISINSGESIQAILGKINAVNDQTQVVATLNSSLNSIVLTSGVMDEDARHIVTANILNIRNSTQPIIGYALTGEQFSIHVAGGGLLASLGLSARSAAGINAAGSINGVAMRATGSVLEDVEFGSVAYGLKLSTDTVNGGNGTYIRANCCQSSNVVQPFAGSISLTVKVNTEKALKLQIGANYNQSMFTPLENISTNQLGIGGSSKYKNLEDIELNTVESASYSLKTIQKAISDVSEARSRLGAMTNRLEYTLETLETLRENLTAAQSRLQDTDMAEEMTFYSKQQILLQTTTAMLSQSNARPQSVLQLLS